MELGLLLFFLFLTAAALALAAKAVRVVPQATVMIVERLGRFYKLADSGLHVLVPFFDRPRGVTWAGLRPGLSSIDLREQFLDMPPQAAITRAQGEKQSAILQAEGAAQARLRQAEAEAEAIGQIARAMLDHGNPAQYLITQRYIESLKEMSKGNNSKVIFMPVETSTMLSSVGAIKEVLARVGEDFGSRAGTGK